LEEEDTRSESEDDRVNKCLECGNELNLVEGEDPLDYDYCSDCDDSPDPRACERCGELRLTGEEEDDESKLCFEYMQEDEESQTCSVCDTVLTEYGRRNCVDRFGPAGSGAVCTECFEEVEADLEFARAQI
jgi:hypothetical protein